MATEGAAAEPAAPARGDPAAPKRDFDVDSLSKPELRMLLSVLEGELEARDLVIEALRARRKEVFIQERYGRFNLSDPFLALQRDYEAGAAEKDKRSICTNPLSILEAVMAHCRKMQERMAAQLVAAENRQKKLEMEKSQLQALEMEHKKLCTRLEEERSKNKHVVLMLVKECKQLSSRIVEEAQKLEDVMAKFEEEKKKASELEESLAAEKQHSTQMEAQMEKQLSEFDTEREQLHARLNREEAYTSNLKEEREQMRKMIEQLKKENDNKVHISLPRRSKERGSVSVSVGTEGPPCRTLACQTDVVLIDGGPENVRRLPLTVPVKPSAANTLTSGHTKMNVGSNATFVKPVMDRHSSCSDLLLSPSTSLLVQGQSRIEENGPSTSPDLTSMPFPNNAASSPAPYLQASSMHSPHSPSAGAVGHQGLNPRVQAARFRFQGNANDQDPNGNTTQSPPSRDVSPTNRDNLVAKQLARNTVTQVLSRFTSPQGAATGRPGMSYSIDAGTYPPPVGRMSLKTPNVSRIDRGNPPPIPPKKPGLSQTPSPPYPQLKVIMDSSRSPNVGAKTDSKTLVSPPSSSSQGIRVINEEVISKSSPQLPPKPTIDISVASGGCAIPAVATSQVGAWPSQPPGLKQPACSESSFVIPTSIVCSSSINPISASSCRPCESDSLLVTASGWSPSLTPLLMSGGPVPLGDRPTLLHQAAAQGNVTLLSMLLNEEGLDVNDFCEDGYSALYSAAMNGHTDCVRLLLTSEAQVDPVDKNGFTPLCSAVAQGHCKCAEILILYHADVNHAAVRGETPLYLACGNGNNECVKPLLEAGADRSTKTSNGWTPFHAAVDAGNVDGLRLLMYYGKPEDENMNDEDANPCIFDLECGEGGFDRKAKPVVSADLINHADKEGWTAAHIAASKGFKTCLEVLCGHGGLEAERKDKCNRTLHDVATDDCKQLLENLNALKIPLRISVSPIEPAYCGTEDLETENTICVLNIRKQTAWDDFSKTVSQALTNHFQAISSDGWRSLEDLTLNNIAASSIGLTESSVLSIKLGNISWSMGQMFSQPPWEFLKRNQVEHIVVFLLGPQEGCLHSVTYATMIHLQTLQNYLRLVEQYRNVIFHGPEGSLQDYVAYQIALCMKHKQLAAGFGCEIIRVKIDPDFSKEQLAELFINSACLIPVKHPPVSKRIILILENLEKVALSELLGEFLQPLENRGSDNPCTLKKANGVSDVCYFHENCFLMGTIAQSRLQGSDLMIQQHFLWVQLRWDGEPIHGLLKRFLRRKVLSKFRGKMPPPCDPVCKMVEWILAVWQQLNSCLSRLGAPEALVGPKHFLSCPVVPGHSHTTVKWMSKLWNAVIAPQVQEAILSRASLKRPSTLGQVAVKKSPSQGQQAVVKAALSILLNKAVLHGCPLSRAELDEYIADFKGGNFPLSMVSSYKNGPKKRGESIAWRKVNTSPRKKSGHSTTQSWNRKEENVQGLKSKNILQENGNKVASLPKKPLQDDSLRILNLEQRLSLGSDDEVDLVQELQSLCSSKSEPDISKIVDSKEELMMMISSSVKDPVHSANIINANTSASQQDANPGVRPLSSSQTVECSNSKSKAESFKSGASRAKSFLPVPRNKVSQTSQNTK